MHFNYQISKIASSNAYHRYMGDVGTRRFGKKSFGNRIKKRGFTKLRTKPSRKLPRQGDSSKVEFLAD